MFHYDNGLMLTRPRLAIDCRRRQPRGFVSHAHADHMARHELALATPATAALYRHRLASWGRRKNGQPIRVLEMPYGEAVEFGGDQLTTVPAGHCLGSAMLLAEQDNERLLYTGDYKLGDSLTATAAELPRADILVMESTFGRPRYCMPPRQQVIAQLLEIVHQAFAEGLTPVIHAYALGKSQEVTKLLTTAGVPVLQHPEIFALSQVYAEFGVEMSSGEVECCEYLGAPLAGHAVVTLPKSMKRYRLAGLGATISIAVTGWAIDPATPRRQGVDHALPLSDHADYNELLETVRRVEPRVVYCTHGPDEFVDHVRAIGFDARPLASDAQGRLF